MSNELNNILSLVTNGIAVGGDRYPGTTFLDHLMRYEQDPECKTLVLLGEVGGIEEYSVIEAVRSGQADHGVGDWDMRTHVRDGGSV